MPDGLIEGSDARLQGRGLTGLSCGSVVGKLDFLENLVCLAHSFIPPQVMTALRERAGPPEWEMIALAFRFDQNRRGESARAVFSLLESLGPCNRQGNHVFCIAFQVNGLFDPAFPFGNVDLVGTRRGYD